MKLSLCALVLVSRRLSFVRAGVSDFSAARGAALAKALSTGLRCFDLKRREFAGNHKLVIVERQRP